MNGNATQATLWFFQNPKSGCPMVLRALYGALKQRFGGYYVVCDAAIDEEPAACDRADADEYTEIVRNAEDDDRAVFALRKALSLDADGDLV